MMMQQTLHPGHLVSEAIHLGRVPLATQKVSKPWSY
jgi:hypothetical protein